MNNPAAIPVPEQPGRVFLPASGQVIQQDQVYEGDFYDTVEFTSFAAAGFKDVFKDQSTGSGNKDVHLTNITQTKRIPSYAKLKLQRIGVHVRQWVGSARPDPEDVVALYELGFLRFSLGSTNLIAEGPLLTFQSGLGVQGVSNRNDFSALTLGVAASTAAPRLLESPDISDKVDLNCRITVGNNEALNASDNTQPTMQGNGTYAHILATVFAHGIITRPLGS